MLTKSMRFPVNKTCFLILGCSLLEFACAIQAPEDYYFQFAKMEGWGKYNRQETGRATHELITHPEDAEPLIIAFEVGKPPAELLGFVPYETPQPQPASQPLADTVRPKVTISLQRKVLRQMFEEQEIQAVHWRLNDGRLEGKQNIVQIHFVPRASSDQAIRKEFLMICAIVNGAQTQESTIDVIKGIVEGEDGTPQMILETQTASYEAYLSGQIDKAEWENRVQQKRF